MRFTDRRRVGSRVLLIRMAIEGVIKGDAIPLAPLKRGGLEMEGDLGMRVESGNLGKAVEL